MFTYEVVELKFNMWKNRFDRDLEELINENALDGWRLMQVVKTPNSTYNLTLIFEKPLAEAADPYRHTRFSGMV